jgi:hypothetical protein
MAVNSLFKFPAPVESSSGNRDRNGCTRNGARLVRRPSASRTPEIDGHVLRDPDETAARSVFFTACRVVF